MRRGLAIMACVLGITHVEYADADTGTPRIESVGIREMEGMATSRWLAVTTTGGVSSLKVTVNGLAVPACDNGTTWRHGAASLTETPAPGAAATLDLRGAGDKPVALLKGFVGADGSLALFGDVTSTASVALRTGFLIGNVGAGGTAIIELAGGDAALVHGATLSIAPGGTGGGDCGAKGGCEGGTGGDPSKEQIVPVVWALVNTEWDCALPEAAKAADPPLWNFHVWAFAEKPGPKPTVGRVDEAKGVVTQPWQDGGEGTSAILAQDDPMTTVALTSAHAAATKGEVKELADILKNQYRVTIVASGWNAADGTCQEQSGGKCSGPGTPPTHAELDIDGGPTLLIPAHGYQRAGAVDVTFDADPTGHTYTVSVDGESATFTVGSGQTYVISTNRRAFGQGKYGLELDNVKLVPNTITVWVTAWAPSPEKLPSDILVEIAPAKGKEGAPAAPAPKEPKQPVALDPDIAAVFGNTVHFTGDPVGANLTGRVALLRPYPGPKVRLVPAVKGTLRGQIASAVTGTLELSAVGKGGPIQSKGDILIGGEPIEIERVDGQGNVVPVLPPALVFKPNGGWGSTAVMGTIGASAVGF